ncbi:DUF1232 domain-containing protein [bacterium]|nr:DUF1232 domain-containing protein [bacterium]
MEHTIRPEDVTPEDEQRVHDRLDEKMASAGEAIGGSVGRLLSNVKLLYAMLRDKGFTIDWTYKAKIIAALLYFIAPIDIIPDFIPGLGYIDDAVVIGYTIKALKDLIEAYKVYRGEPKISQKN